MKEPQTGHASAGPIGLGAAGEPLDASALEFLLDNVPVALGLLAGEQHRHAFANAYYRAAIGATGPVVGLAAAEVMSPALANTWIPILDDVHRSGRPFDREAVVLPGTGRWWHVMLFPVQDAAGGTAGVLVLGLDATAEVLARDEAARSAYEAETEHQRLKLAVEATELGTWEWDVLKGEVNWSDRQKAIFGLSPEEPTTYETWRDGIHPDDRDRVVAAVGRLLEPGSGGVLSFEHRIVLPTGEIRWISASGRMLYRGEGPARVPVRLLGTALDITDRKAAEEARQLLLREMNHRVKNLFAVAAAIVNGTARRATDPRAMADAVVGRLSALAASHALVNPLIEDGVARPCVRLADLVHAALKPFSDETSVAVDGPDVQVSPAVAPSLALVLHELATNAAKYGALRGGRLQVAWTVSDRELELAWVEVLDAPGADPGQAGFGSVLLRRTVETTLGGRVVREWTGDGLDVRIGLPLARLG